MPCYSPLNGYQEIAVNENGTRTVKFGSPDINQKWYSHKIKLPCGRCTGCRLEKSRQWALRCVHEASLYEKNCFITLTYEDKYNPITLNTIDFQKFMKRLRKYFNNEKIRFYHAGEYGKGLQRPHHHACLFNCDFDDKKLIEESDISKTYSSETLDKLWPWGFTSVGSMTFESAAYVARYTMKKVGKESKVTGKHADEHYKGKKPEYSTMSRKPGIGHQWIKENKNDVYPNDYVVTVKGVKSKPPRYYDNILDKDNNKSYIIIKNNRHKASYEKRADNISERLQVKEIVKLAQIKNLKRTI